MGLPVVPLLLTSSSELFAQATSLIFGFLARLNLTSSGLPERFQDVSLAPACTSPSLLLSLKNLLIFSGKFLDNGGL